MWSLLRRPHSDPSDHSPAAIAESLSLLFKALLDQVTDKNAHDAFATQFAAAQNATGTKASAQAQVFEAVLTYLAEHQPPATKTTLTNEELQTLITQHVDPSVLDPALMGALATGPLQIAGILGLGIERLTQLYFTNVSQEVARASLDTLMTHLPFQLPPDMYSAMTTTEVPNVRPLLKPLADLGRSDLLSNMKYLYQYFIDALVKNNQQPQASQAMQEVYGYISQTYPQELTLLFLDLVPSGWLDQERGNLLGRDELLRVLDELQQEKAKLEAVSVRDEALLSSIGDGVVAVAPDGKVIFVNNSALEMLGMQSIDVTSINWFQAVVMLNKNEQPIAIEANPMVQAIKTQKPVVTNDLSMVRPDKTKLAAAITATPYVANGEMAGAILVFKDMSHEREVDRQKTEFISVASHQLRTPLGSMKLNLEMLLRNYQGALTPEVSQMVKETLEVNERTLKLVNTLLDISRIETGRVQDNPEEVKVDEVLVATVKELEPISAAKNVQLKTEITPGLPALTIDGARLREIFENVISNAIKYSHQGGVVTATLSLKDDSILIEIADQGIGIPEKEQFKMFSRFFRAENALNQEPNGSGFGLFVVKSYIEGWGGKIWFKSPTLENKTGTTFYLQIPLKVEQPADGLYLDTRDVKTLTPPTPTQEPAV